MERRHIHRQEQPAVSWTELTNKMRERGVSDDTISALVERGVRVGASAPTANLLATADLLIETRTRELALKNENSSSALEVDAPTRVLRGIGGATRSASGRISGRLEPDSRAQPAYSTPPPELQRKGEPQDLSTEAVRAHIKSLYEKGE